MPTISPQVLQQAIKAQQTEEAQELKRAIRQLRYEISLAAAAPDSLQRLPALYNQLAAIYKRQEQSGETGYHGPVSSS